jgi:hypothetical protein
VGTSHHSPRSNAVGHWGLSTPWECLWGLPWFLSGGYLTPFFLEQCGRALRHLHTLRVPLELALTPVRWVPHTIFPGAMRQGIEASSHPESASGTCPDSCPVGTSHYSPRSNAAGHWGLSTLWECVWGLPWLLSGGYLTLFFQEQCGRALRHLHNLQSISGVCPDSCPVGTSHHSPRSNAVGHWGLSTPWECLW